MELWHISILALSITTILCVVGTLAPSYNDNLTQRLGMALLAYGCASRVQAIWLEQFVAADWLAVHVGIALYGLGTAWCQWRLNVIHKRWQSSTVPLDLDESQQVHIVGGKR